MVSSDLWINTNARLKEIFMLAERTFAGLIFSQFSDKDSMKHLLGLQLWNLLKFAELTQVARQNDLG